MSTKLLFGGRSLSSAAEASNNASAVGKPLVVVDARPLLNATANQAAGKGFESEKYYENTSVLFMDIANIHAVRKSLELVGEACIDEANWLRNLDASAWLTHLRKILQACLKIVHCVAFEDMSVLVHCSDGWDRTTQLTSISMMLIDPYYRTLSGFMVLIEKEWISFGHKFADRLGWTRHGWRDEERSDVFLQFLDCVHQVVVQRPNAFEFNSSLLVFLAEYLHSGWFGSFLFNCEREYVDNKYRTISIWAPILYNQERFVNKTYVSLESPLIPVVSQQRIVIWSDWFLRWYDRIWESAWKNDASRDKLNRDFESLIPFSFWADDKSAKGCKRCTKKFTMIRRKHHCRVCGQIFCESCASEMRMIPQVSTWRLSRCCIDCARAVDMSNADKRNSGVLSMRSTKLSMNSEKTTNRSMFSQNNEEHDDDDDNNDDDDWKEGREELHESGQFGLTGDTIEGLLPASNVGFHDNLDDMVENIDSRISFRQSVSKSVKIAKQNEFRQSMTVDKSMIRMSMSGKQHNDMNNSMNTSVVNNNNNDKVGHNAIRTPVKSANRVRSLSMSNMSNEPVSSLDDLACFYEQPAFNVATNKERPKPGRFNAMGSGCLNQDFN